MKLLKKIKNLLTGKTFKNFIHLRNDKKKQNELFFQNLKKWIKDGELVVFFTSEKESINGGIMSIFNLAKYSRDFNKNVILMTLGKKWTHLKNTMFNNDEDVYRFEQLFDIYEDIDNLTLNIPECWVKKFNKLLTLENIEKFRKIKNLHINILNQNIELMPNIEEINKLKALTDNVTQTTAHSAYATQEIANKYSIPTHFLLTYTDFSVYYSTKFEDKKKIIVLSPDSNEHKKEVVDLLKNNFTDYKFVTVKNMTFIQYTNLISEASVVLTFGEGFDGYFMQPPLVGTISIAVYNDTFFPSKEWQEFPTVYKSWQDLKQNIYNDLRNYFNDEELYYKIVENCKNCEFNIMQKDKFVDNMKRFYQKKYDFYPSKEPNNR